MMDELHKIDETPAIKSISEDKVVIEHKDENGELAQRVTMENGVLHGPMEMFEKGKMIQKLNFNHGKLEGDCFTYNEEGHLLQIAAYKNGIKSGVSKIFVNRVLYAEMFYEDGLPADE
jgi:antitoxin component YwqK of YwqJK toxin-antitoxin module